MSLFWRHKGTAALPRLVSEISGSFPAAEAEARRDLERGAPYCRIMTRVVKTAFNSCRLPHRKTPAMSRRLAVARRPYTCHAHDGLISRSYLVGLLTDVRTSQLIRLVKSPKLKNVQTFLWKVDIALIQPVFATTRNPGLRASIIHRALLLHVSHRLSTISCAIVLAYDCHAWPSKQTS
jgi:hypothetical protein